jgi:hypothetical protein
MPRRHGRCRALVRTVPRFPSSDLSPCGWARADSELEPIPGLTYTITNPGEFQAKTGDYEEVKLQITKGDLSAYDEVEMRLCFSTADIKDRPWRKFNDVIKVRLVIPTGMSLRVLRRHTVIF